ncbi:MAG: TraB/GumN family protein [Nitrosomonadales bacterium]|nr:TraB/GumN family protein [Nitrosomonadales bacterium]
MLNTIRIGLLTLLLAIASSARAGDKPVCPPVAEKPTPESVQAGVRNARDHGFLWRISKEGRTSFLYGTIHVARFDWMFPGPRVTQALQATDTLALELDMLDADIQGRMSRGMSSHAGFAVPGPLVERMRKQAEAVCIPFAALASLSPELQITTLTLMDGRWEGLDPAYAIDAVLAGIGHGTNKNVVSLETPESQLQMLQMSGAEETAAFVADGLDDLETGRARKSFSRIARVWADGDFDELSNYEKWCECLDTDSEREMMRRLLDERNPTLAERIDALHAGGKRVFAAVGSLHMFGPTGLPTLLGKRGYRVERIVFNTKY